MKFFMFSVPYRCTIIIIITIISLSPLLLSANELQQGVAEGGKNGNPGVKVRLTENGLNYLNDIIRQQMSIIIPRIRIDDMHVGKRAGITVTNGRVTNYKAPDSQSLTPQPPDRLVLTMKNMDMAVQGHLQVDVAMVKKGTDFDGNAKGIDVTYLIKLSKRSDGHLNLKLDDCKANVGSCDVNLHNMGILGTALQTVKGSLKNILRRRLAHRICTSGRRYFDEAVDKQITAKSTKIWLNGTETQGSSGTRPNQGTDGSPEDDVSKQTDTVSKEKDKEQKSRREERKEEKNKGNKGGRKEGKREERKEGRRERGRRGRGGRDSEEGKEGPQANDDPMVDVPGENDDPMTNDPGDDHQAAVGTQENGDFKARDIPPPHENDPPDQLKNISNYLMLDYSNIRNPVVTKTYLETYHKGDVSYMGQGGTPFYPNDLHHPNPFPTERMVYILVSDYVANSLLYHSYKHGLLKYRLTSETAPDMEPYLKTNCESDFFPGLCLGAIIPQIQKSFPNSKVEVLLEPSKSAPALFFQPDGLVHIQAPVMITLNAIKGTEKKLMAIADGYVTARAKLRAETDKITGNATIDKMDLTMRTNNIKNFGE